MRSHVGRDAPNTSPGEPSTNPLTNNMNTRLIQLVTLLSVTLAGACCSAPRPARGAPPLKVLVVTGGHGFEREPFLQMFQSNPEIVATTAAHAPTNASVFERDDLLTYDVVVLYDMMKTLTGVQQARFLALLEKGIGLVVLHHALVSYQHWPDYERMIGGRYPEEDGKGGVVTAQVGYEHDVEIPVTVLTPAHPITSGLKDFVIRDEIYWGFRVGADVTPLLSTTQPKSGKLLAWTRTERNSRVVYIQLGHGPSAYENPNYRMLLARSIEWAAQGHGETAETALFDGSTLDGWVQHGGAARYAAEEGQIVGRCTPNTANSFLCTRRDFTNFDLRLEFKVDEGLNSGVQIRSHVFPMATQFVWGERTIKVPAGRVHGLQVEIDPSARAWTGGFTRRAPEGGSMTSKRTKPRGRLLGRVNGISFGSNAEAIPSRPGSMASLRPI